ncbi:MAG: hypothetical protein AAGJ35_01960, partial [Myxococcota bacterium]
AAVAVASTPPLRDGKVESHVSGDAKRTRALSEETKLQIRREEQALEGHARSERRTPSKYSADGALRAGFPHLRSLPELSLHDPDSALENSAGDHSRADEDPLAPWSGRAQSASEVERFGATLRPPTGLFRAPVEDDSNAQNVARGAPQTNPTASIHRPGFEDTGPTLTRESEAPSGRHVDLSLASSNGEDVASIGDDQKQSKPVHRAVHAEVSWWVTGGVWLLCALVFLLGGGVLWWIQERFDLLGRYSGVPMRLILKTQPAGADVLVEGRILGKTPLTLERRWRQRLDYVLIKKGYAMAAGFWEAQRTQKRVVILWKQKSVALTGYAAKRRAKPTSVPNKKNP